MLGKRLLQFAGLRGLFHFRQRLENLVLGEIDVLERIMKKYVERLG